MRVSADRGSGGAVASTAAAASPRRAAAHRSGDTCGSRAGFALVVVALVALAALRSSVGLSFSDDSYYAAVSLRLAQGARMFVDEMMLQSLGFLVPAAFAKLWTSFMGTTGIVLALRLFYVALATGVGAVAYLALRPTFGRWATLAAVAVPLLAPPFNLLAASYNTMAQLGLLLGCVLAFASVRDARPWLAVASGAALGFASISYPPLILAAVCVPIVLALRPAHRRTAATITGAAAVLLAGFAVWTLVGAPIDDLVRSLQYILAVGRIGGQGVGGGIGRFSNAISNSLPLSFGVPIWICWIPAVALSMGGAVAARRGRAGRRTLDLAIAFTPVAVLLPAYALWGVHGFHPTGWTFAAVYVISVAIFAVPLMLAHRRYATRDQRLLLAIAAPMSAVGALVTTLATSAGAGWGVPVVGIAPFVAYFFGVWARTVRRAVSRRAQAPAVLAVLGLVMVLLTGVSFKDVPRPGNTVTIPGGPMAGITMSRYRSRFARSAESFVRAHAKSSDTVMFVRFPLGYVLSGAHALTNAVLLTTGPSDTATLDYFSRAGQTPGRIFIWNAEGGTPASEAHDPLLTWIRTHYRKAAERNGLVVFERP